ncbi:hypothetical protein BDZ45DRAFT_240382 [Acephala macrosclerotiorum]|nr:hypothetical protein BDZ45DRAFT_240382 [Acephala macrosclerotiorum]
MIVHRDVVVKAWRNALVIAKLAADSLAALVEGSDAFEAFAAEAKPQCAMLKSKPGTLSYDGQKQYMLCYRIFLAANHLAYGQYFGADPENIELSMTSPVNQP